MMKQLILVRKQDYPCISVVATIKISQKKGLLALMLQQEILI